MLFHLGTDRVHWLRLTDVPLFLSTRSLSRYKTLPVALGPWALDSGGFTELNRDGKWTTTVDGYVAAATRYRDEVGGLAWAAPMDWMCEPVVLAKTGMTVREHQARTVGNYIDLRSAAPDLPFVPVLQGWTLDDYLRCVDLYASAGIDLRVLALVGIGSVCRRQSTSEIAHIVGTVASLGINLHGFGVKTSGLARYAEDLTSADSMAWSYRARMSPPLAGCAHKHCNHCLRYALRWRLNVLRATGIQRLPFGAVA